MRLFKNSSRRLTKEGRRFVRVGLGIAAAQKVIGDLEISDIESTYQPRQFENSEIKITATGENNPADIDEYRNDDPSEVASIIRHLENPAVRARVAEMISEEIRSAGEREPVWKRFGPWLASASSAILMILAFFIPSVEDQWDRYQSRQIIQQHVSLGRSFLRDGKYELAEKSFAKAFELSDSKRLDIEEERLKAKVEAVNADPTWGAKNPEGLDEADFLYLLQLEKDKSQAKERSATLNAYGTFLASETRDREAEPILREAISLDSMNDEAQISLGNLLRSTNRLKEAEAAYREALRIDGEDVYAHYDLGLVLSETKRPQEAEDAFRKAAQIAPEDTELLNALARQLERNGKSGEAQQLFKKVAQIEALKPKKKPEAPKFEAAA